MNLRATKRIISTILFLLLFGISVSDLHARNSSSPSVEFEAALALSNAFLPTLNRNPKNLKLVKAENLVFSGPHLLGPAIWRFTYKERSLIPKDGQSLLGLGGELFIEVDLNNKKARFLGAGE